jgi:hypothetical protein
MISFKASRFFPARYPVLHLGAFGLYLMAKGRCKWFSA